jgi:hypothetical protein
MKTRIIPAQITTVEDKIAGNLNLTQIVLLMLPIFWLMIVYTLFTPQMNFTLYKVPLIFVVSISFMILALRIKGKIVIEWLVILATYNTRPRYYLFDKNNTYLRDIAPIPSKQKVVHKASVRQEKSIPKLLSPKELLQLEQLLARPDVRFSVKAERKGGFNVAFEQNK